MRGYALLLCTPADVTAKRVAALPADVGKRCLRVP